MITDSILQSNWWGVPLSSARPAPQLGELLHHRLVLRVAWQGLVLRHHQLHAGHHWN